MHIKLTFGLESLFFVFLKKDRHPHNHQTKFNMEGILACFNVILSKNNLYLFYVVRMHNISTLATRYVLSFISRKYNLLLTSFVNIYEIYLLQKTNTCFRLISSPKLLPFIIPCAICDAKLVRMCATQKNLGQTPFLSYQKIQHHIQNQCILVINLQVENS